MATERLEIADQILTQEDIDALRERGRQWLRSMGIEPEESYTIR